MGKRKLPDRYVYPAVFTYYGPEKEIAVDFPDLGTATSGTDDKDALFSARECLGLVMFGLEEDGEEIPTPSPLSEVHLEGNETVGLVDVYMPTIRLAQRNTVQRKFEKNTFDKTMKYAPPLLKGVARCAKCGSKLPVAHKKNTKSISSFYYCRKRDQQGIEACDMKALKCELLDNKALAIFAEIEADPKAIWKYTAANDQPKDYTATIRDLERKAAAIQSRIQKLTESLSLAAGSSAAKYIVKQIETEDLSLASVNREIDVVKANARREENAEKSTEEKAEEIARIMRNLSQLSAEEKNEMIKSIVKECAWDGESLFLRL